MSFPDSAAPEQRFSNRVENYVRYRPSYPPEMMQWLQHEAGITISSVIADIGSGTGISTRLFLDLNSTVYGVEPNLAMRQAAENLLANHPHFYSIDGKAHATTLPDQSIDLIVAAQAFHWFDVHPTREEFSRILKPEGHIALIWNVRSWDTTPFLQAYEALLLRFGTDYTQVRHERIDATALTKFFIGPYITRTFSNEQWFDYPSLEGRLMSSSYAPASGEPDHTAMLEELHRIFDLHQQSGKVCIEYQTELHLGR